MRLERYSAHHRSLWDGFVADAKNSHFMHMRDYMEYHSDRFLDHSLMVFTEDNECIALLPANEADKVLYSHQGLTFGGFVTNKDMRAAKMVQVVEAVKRYCVDQAFTKLVYKSMPTFYHQTPASEDIYALFLHNAHLCRIDISTTVDYANPVEFSSLRKRGAKKAEKHGVRVAACEDYSSFHAILSDVIEKKYNRAATHSLAEMKLLAKRFPDNIKLFGAFLGEDMVAGVLIFETATVAHAQYIASSELGRSLGGLDTLFSELVLREFHGKRFFDFGISTEEGGKYLNEGLISQKEGFGGRATLHHFYELPL